MSKKITAYFDVALWSRIKLACSIAWDIAIHKALECVDDDARGNVIKYEHHGRMVCVFEDLKDRHRKHCLCHSCRRFRPLNQEVHCPIAKAVYKNCVELDIVTPMWECPVFEQDLDGGNFADLRETFGGIEDVK